MFRGVVDLTHRRLLDFLSYIIIIEICIEIGEITVSFYLRHKTLGRIFRVDSLANKSHTGILNGCQLIYENGNHIKDDSYYSINLSLYDVISYCLARAIIHGEVMHAWADGAEIEYYDVASMRWELAKHPNFLVTTQYRIKVEPAPPIIRYMSVSVDQTLEDAFDVSNLKLVFDAETKKLISAEVIDGC